jgi:hypothetical protein
VCATYEGVAAFLKECGVTSSRASGAHNMSTRSSDGIRALAGQRIGLSPKSDRRTSSSPGGGNNADHGLSIKIVRLKKGQILVPGFIDTHVHAPQYSFTGTATDKPLMEWLQEYTFPAERRLKDLSQAR